ncbi:MAG: hypothetical protein IKQ34_01985 [Bacilli bacterium]|nr:hypothetical protein [Bacilli bacterium]MBR6056272.1 hypothetical protein [Bacilli bacterium]
MKSIKNRSLFAILLSAFALSSCQEMPKVDDSLGNVEASSYAQSTTCSGGTSVPESSSSTYPEVHIRDMDNGVIVVLEGNEWIPLQGYSFRVDNLNEEFTLTLRELTVKETGERLLRGVMSLYLADVNKDGYLDFVYTNNGADRSRNEVGTWVGIYDYHNDAELFRLDEPLKYDYEFGFENHEIVVGKWGNDKYDTYNVLDSGPFVGKGILDYSHSTITVNWQNYLNIDSSTLRVTTSDSARTPMPLLPSQQPTEDQGVLIYPDANTFIIENVKADKAYCITSTIARNSGNYDDLPDTLPVAYHGHALFKQAIASKTEDNVIVSFLEQGTLEDGANKSISIEICFDSLVYTIIFKFDSYQSLSDAQTLKEAMGWSFTKEQLVQFTSESIPGSHFDQRSEEDDPFMHVSIVREGEATRYSYSLLEATVAEIDPALVDPSYTVGHYNYITSSGTYTINEHLAFLENGGSYYSVLNKLREFRYALNSTETYRRFRDGHNEITVQNRSGSVLKVLQNANKILFKTNGHYLTEEESNRLKSECEYTFTIAGNNFYVLGNKEMISDDLRFEVISNNDFSSLFAK